VTSISFHEQLRRSTYIFTAITRPSDVRMAQIVRLVQYQEVTLQWNLRALLRIKL
jgi:hypothetical protein